VDYMSRQERQRREMALAVAAKRSGELAARQELTVAAERERATRLIRQPKMAATLPDAESLLATLLDRVDPASALDIADKLDDAELKIALLKRSMS
jgi:hypothetical protein